MYKFLTLFSFLTLTHSYCLLSRLNVDAPNTRYFLTYDETYYCPPFHNGGPKCFHIFTSQNITEVEWITNKYNCSINDLNGGHISFQCRCDPNGKDYQYFYARLKLYTKYLDYTHAPTLEPAFQLSYIYFALIGVIVLALIILIVICLLCCTRRRYYQSM